MFGAVRGRHLSLWSIPSPVFLALLCCAFKAAHGFPSTILTSTATKCVQLDVGEELVITVEYDAPDINSTTLGEKGKDPRKVIFAGQDMTLLVYQREDESSVSNAKTSTGVKKRTGTRKVRIQIEQEKGDILFYTGNSPGILEICRQSYKATPTNPRRLGLKIAQRAATVQEKLKNMAISTKGDQEEEMIPNKDQSAGILNAETSRISIELNRMVDKLHELYSQAERSKDVERDFHDKSIRLNGAVRFWPMFRIVVVILAGIIQVSLVVNYMKSKHIY